MSYLKARRCSKIETWRDEVIGVNQDFGQLTLKDIGNLSMGKTV